MKYSGRYSFYLIVYLLAMLLIKLGGSVITKKSQKGIFNNDTMDNLSKQIKKSNQDVILVHGAGSFGHILANKFELNEGYKRIEQLIGFAKTHSLVQKLNTYVIESLQKNNIPSVSISPHSIAKFSDQKLKNFDFAIFKDYIKNGFVPVTFGDVILDTKIRFSICSGDILIRALAKEFKPKKVIFVIDEDGLYENNPKIVKNAKFIDSTTISELNNLKITIDSHDDVTRGMKGKIDTIRDISRMGIDTILLNGHKEDRLYKVMKDKKTKATLVYGE
jgi:isopentenyl phosphate kinase